MQYQYVVSAHKSSSVVSAVSGPFLSPDEQNLIVGRGNRLQVFRKTATGHLDLVGEHAVNGQLQHVRFFQPSDRSTGMLLIVSSKQQFAVVVWDMMLKTMVTESTGKFIERTGRSSTQTLVAVDPESRVFAISSYQGIVHLFPMGKRDAADQLPFAVQDEHIVGGILVPEYLRNGAAGASSLARGRRGKGREHMAKSTDVHGVSALYVDELKIIDMCFCRDTRGPQLAVLYEDADMTRRVKVYDMVSVRGEVQLVSQRSCSFAATSMRLVALPEGAVLVLGHSYLSMYKADSTSQSLALSSTDVCDVCWVDPGRSERLLLADSSGALTLVAFDHAAKGFAASGPSISRLGSIPVASAVAYLGDGCVFIGSHCGDSLLVRLLAQSMRVEPADAQLPGSNVLARSNGVAETATYVQPLESFTNLAPIVDLCVVGQGPGQGQKVAGSIVACSGLRNTPALRIVRNGVAIANIAGLEAHGILRVWALTVGGSQMDIDHAAAPDRKVLVVASMAARSVVLGWPESEDCGDSVEMAELGPCGWATDEPTLAAAAVDNGSYAVQVTVSCVLLLDSRGNQVFRWTPEQRGAISVAAVCGSQVAVAVGATVHYVEVRGSHLVSVATRVLSSDVACIDIHAWDVGRPSTHVAVGLWGSGSVGLLSVPDLVPVDLDLALPGDGGLPRSILQCTLGATRYLLIGLGDGRLHHFALHDDTDNGQLAVAEHKCVTLGTHPLSLTPFFNHGSLNVFAASDYSAVLFASGVSTASSEGESRRPGRLMYANVDAMDIACVAAIGDSLAFPDALCLVSQGRLWIGRPDPVQNLHVRAHALPAWAEPNRIAYNQSVYALATIHVVDPDSPALPWDQAGLEPGVRGLLQSGQPEEFGRLSILDAQTMDVLASLLLEPFESPLSLCAATLESPTGTLRDAFVLGTSVVLPGEDDARKGRVLLLQWDESGRRLCIVGSFATVGSVYAVAGFRGMVLAAVANRLLLLGWQTRRQPPSDSVGELPDRVFVAPDADHELVAFCSQQTQIASLSLSVAGDCIVVGDILASASLYRYERQQVKQPRPAHATSAAVDFSLQGGSAGADELVVRHRLVPLARDASGVWTTAVSAVPPPLAQNHALLLPAPVEEETGSGAGSGGRQSMPSYSQTFLAPSCERFVVADAYHNIIRLACTQAEQQSADGANIQEHRLLVEGRWHLGDQINVIKTGSLVMDIPDPEFPDYFRPHLVFGTLNGAVGVIASVENGKLGRILDRLQINMAHLLPTPGLWSYDRWRAYTSDKRDCESFGYLDGDLIESFLDLSAEMQKLVFSGGGLLLSADKKSQAERERKLEYWSSFSRVEGEADCRCLGQFAVSDIALREGVSLDFVKRLVESLTRLH